MTGQRTRNVMNGTRPRNTDDAYFTPDALALAICQKLRTFIGHPGVVIEPSAGEGAFVRAVRETWPESFIVAVEPNGGASEGANVYSAKTWEEYEAPQRADLIIGNPPFSLAEEHIKLAISRARYSCFLLRASFLAGRGRWEHLHRYGNLAHVWHVIGRPSFADGKTDAAEYAVLVWDSSATKTFRTDTPVSFPFRGDWLVWK